MKAVGRPGRLTDSVLTVEWLPGDVGLRVVGEVDVATAGEWAEVLAALQADDVPGRLDLSGLSFIDVRGVAALAEAARRLPSGRLRLYRPPWCLRRTLDVVWTDEMDFIVIEDEETE
jgi:anti-anti-sigma factor